ncbi:uncharacterized protein LOC130499051 [Raphanus sativus]|uniref:Uncharacterized protein LOC130499051 n=1 Tax=Raphanus sativus TaxID=3726 RepID=A0A9W3CBI1_RAPSA|nr:uncharacterized protein LOC130499051 [Raphanus sativus]
MEVYIDDMLAHQIVVGTSFPIEPVLHKPEGSGRLAKWAIELGEYDVIFRPATAIKSQVLADFVAEFSPAMLQALEQEIKFHDSEGEKGEWTLYVDGSSNVRGAGVGLLLTSPTGESASRAVRYNFKETNNEADYEALIAGLTLAKQMGVEDIQVFSDLQLIISQVKGDYQAKDPSMIRYLSVAKRLLDRFRHCKLTQIPREHNSQAEALVNLGSTLETTSHMSIPLRLLQWPATEKETEPEEVSVVDEGETWMTPIIYYLRYDTLPEDRDESRKIRRQATRYCFSEGKLYRRSFSGPYLRCLTPREAARILEELHEGECGSHSSGRSLSKLDELSPLEAEYEGRGSPRAKKYAGVDQTICYFLHSSGSRKSQLKRQKKAMHKIVSSEDWPYNIHYTPMILKLQESHLKISRAKGHNRFNDCLRERKTVLPQIRQWHKDIRLIRNKIQRYCLGMSLASFTIISSAGNTGRKISAKTLREVG